MNIKNVLKVNDKIVLRYSLHGISEKQLGERIVTQINTVAIYFNNSRLDIPKVSNTIVKDNLIFVLSDDILKYWEEQITRQIEWANKLKELKNEENEQLARKQIEYLELRRDKEKTESKRIAKQYGIEIPEDKILEFVYEIIK